MKLALLLITRNKVVHTAAAVKSMFMQEGPPIEILLSDSGSVDGTRQVLDDLARSYNGPHTVRRLDCPCAQSPGMRGMNEHLNWAVTQTDADAIMQLSGDDYDLAQRALLTRKAFEEHSPSMVLVSQYYVSEAMAYQGETPHAEEDRWCNLEDMTIRLIGGSTCQAWTRQFWEKIGPIDGLASMDVIMPTLAVMDKGAYLLKTRAHCYRRVLSENNVGLEGVYYSYPEKDPRRFQLEELMHFQVASGWREVIAKMDKNNWRTDERTVVLANAFLDRCMNWIRCREQLSFSKIPPLPFKV